MYNEIEFYRQMVSCLGLVWILEHGSILDFIRTPLCRIRFFSKLFTCALCLGFWVGLVLNHYFFSNDITFCFVSAAFCWFMDLIIMIFCDIHKILRKFSQ